MFLQSKSASQISLRILSLRPSRQKLRSYLKAHQGTSKSVNSNCLTSPYTYTGFTPFFIYFNITSFHILKVRALQYIFIWWCLGLLNSWKWNYIRQSSLCFIIKIISVFTNIYNDWFKTMKHGQHTPILLTSCYGLS